MIEIQPNSDYNERAAALLRLLRPHVPVALFEARLKRAHSNGYRTLVAEREGLAIGCLGYHFAHDIHWGKSLYIDDLIVHPDGRDTGIGGALIDAIKSAAAKTDCDHIRLCSGLSRVDAHRFYKRHGLEQTSLQFAHALA